MFRRRAGPHHQLSSELEPDAYEGVYISIYKNLISGETPILRNKSCTVSSYRNLNVNSSPNWQICIYGTIIKILIDTVDLEILAFRIIMASIRIYASHWKNAQSNRFIFKNLSTIVQY